MLHEVLYCKEFHFKLVVTLVPEVNVFRETCIFSHISVSKPLFLHVKSNVYSV